MNRYQIYRVIKEYSYAEVEAKDDKEIMELLKEGVIDEELANNQTHDDEEYKIIDEDGRVVHHENCG